MIDDITISDEAYDALEAIILRHMPGAHGCAVAELRGAILDEWLPLLDRPQIEILDALGADDCAQMLGEDTPDDARPVATEGLGDPADWAIDETAGRPVLTYQRCSVIQDEQALTLMRLIAVATEVPF